MRLESFEEKKNGERRGPNKSRGAQVYLRNAMRNNFHVVRTEA